MPTRPPWNTFLSISTLIANATVENRITYDDLMDKTMSIVRTCTMVQSNDALLLAGEYEDFFQRSLLDDIPVALISEAKSTAFELFTLSKYSFEIYTQFSFLYLIWKLNQFVIVASSQPLLRLLLQKTKDSGWANFTGFHILIDRRTVEHGCVNAYNFLWAAWEYDRLSTIFLCIDPVEGLVLYTYNPYSSVAPRAWKDVGHFKGRSGHPWILLKQRYRDDSRLCENLMFDKTRDLNGYEIRLNAISFEPHLQIDQSKPGLQKFTGDNSEIVKLVLVKLNASLNVRVYTGSVYDLGGVGKHGSMVGMMADVANGEVDMGMNARSLNNMWKVEHTYPHGDDGLCVITQRAGEIAEFVKLWSFTAPIIHIGNFAMFTIALVILAKYQGFCPAFMNIIRMMTFVSIRKLPRTSSCRIFFCSVFVLYLIVNALVQSHWASLLTIPVPLPNIRTAKDLKNSGYQIYGSMFHELELQDPILRSRFHEDTYYACKQHVLRSPYAACLGDCQHQYVRIQNDYLYRSKKIQQNLQIYVTRENWPLLPSVTDMIHRTVESGISSMWKKFNKRNMVRAWKKKQMNHKRSFRNLKIKHVAFTFYALAIGNLFAIVIFISEIIVGRKRVRNRVDKLKNLTKL